MSQRTFDDFDEFADDYRSVHTQNIKLSGADSLYFAQQKIKLLTPFEVNQPFAVLDIGCGDGSTELFIQQYFCNWKVLGIDVSEQSILEAQKKALPNASFSFYNGTSIPLEDGCVDIVFIAGVLHHIGFHLHSILIKEMHRVLKKGGRLYLFEHNPFNPLTRYLVNTCVFDKEARLLNSGYTRKLLQQNGFKISSRQFLIFFPRKGLLSKFIFLEQFLKWLPLGGQYFFRATK